MQNNQKLIIMLVPEDKTNSEYPVYQQHNLQVLTVALHFLIINTNTFAFKNHLKIRKEQKQLLNPMAYKMTITY